MVEDCSMTVVKVAGCQLGVKDGKGLPLLKEWLIATTSPKMAARISLECPGDHRHAYSGHQLLPGRVCQTSCSRDDRGGRARLPRVHEVLGRAWGGGRPGNGGQPRGDRDELGRELEGVPADHEVAHLDPPWL
eukprot:9482798-Pyramimonas_sp.AAC.1